MNSGVKVSEMLISDLEKQVVQVAEYISNEKDEKDVDWDLVNKYMKKVDYLLKTITIMKKI